MKIDCIMLPVPDPQSAAAFYERVFGVRRLWSDEAAVGLGMPGTDAEIVVHNLNIPPEYGVHYLVADIDAAVAAYLDQGCGVRVPPFDIETGRCAVLADPYGNPVCLVDLTKGGRT